MRKLHLDTDLGGDIDDLCALAMVLNWPEVELVAVTTVSDDRGKRAGYARYALALAGRRDIPVCAGADISQGYYHPLQPGSGQGGKFLSPGLQPPRRVGQARQGFLNGRSGHVVLTQEVQQLRTQADAGIQHGVGAGHVSAQLDEVFEIAVGGERLAQRSEDRLGGKD